MQGGFIVPSGSSFLLLLVQHQGVDQLPGLANASVQIDGSQQRLHRIGLDGGAGPAAAVVLPLAQAEIAAQIQALGHFHQAVLTHQGRPDAGQVPFRQVWTGAVKMVRHHQAQDGVSQKFQPLVAVGVTSPVLVGIGTVGEGVLQQAFVLEGIAEFFFQWLHCCLPPPADSPIHPEGAAGPWAC